MFCAANEQNLQGTRDVVQNLNSERVRALRRERSLSVLIAPSRVQLDSANTDRFRAEFQPFDNYLPRALAERGMSFWDLLIPYNPVFAFRESIATHSAQDAGEDSFRRSFETLARAIAAIADPASRVRALTEDLSASMPGPMIDGDNSTAAQRSFLVADSPSPKYDLRKAFAGRDVFISYNDKDLDFASAFVTAIEARGKVAFAAFRDVLPGDRWEESINRELAASATAVILIGSEIGGQQFDELFLILKKASDRLLNRIIPVLIPGGAPESVPEMLRAYQCVDLRSGLNAFGVDTVIDDIDGRSPRATVETIDRNPYVGLQAFSEADAPFFFGRDAIVSGAVIRLTSNRFLAVIGPSGSGKSSLVRAGIIPALRRENPNRVVVIVRPSVRPLEALANGLASALDHYGAAEEDLLSRLESTSSLGNILGTRRRVLVVVDQLEELWQLQDKAERAHFLRLLASVNSYESELLMIVTLRADFYGEAAEEPAFAEVLSKNQLLISRMTRFELREAIEGPARATGNAFEPGLVDLICNDSEDSVSALPVLQLVLMRLWQERRRGYITHDSYARLGGIQAISILAEEKFDSLTLPQRVLGRQIFLRLVSAGGYRIPVPLRQFSESEREVIEISSVRLKSGCPIYPIDN
jgi:hypothetical protein